MQERKMKTTKMFLLFLTVLFFIGCAYTKTVTITSDPGGAKVYLNSMESGITTLTKELSFDGNKQIEVIAKKEGYKDGKAMIGIEPRDKIKYHIQLEADKKEVVSVELVSFEPQPTDKGVELAIVRKPTLAYLETIERSPNVMSVTRVTNNEDMALQIGAPILSPVADILVYQVFIGEKDGSYCNIWKQAVGSYAKTRVTYGKWLDLFPSFTPDGLYLIFSSNRTSPNPTLWQIKVEGGSGITKITYTSAEDHSSSVSSDGNIIAYASIPTRANESQIWTVQKDGSLPTQLREGESPQISPDGKTILFVRKDNDSRKKQLWLMNIDGSAETLLTQNIDYDVVDPKWSPNGKWIVFASDEGFDSKKNRNYDIWLMASDGTKRAQLTTNGSRDDSPCWDHTCKFIFFRSNRGGTWNIWRFNPMMSQDDMSGRIPQEPKTSEKEESHKLQ